MTSTHASEKKVIQVKTIQISQIQIKLANKIKANIKNTEMNRPYPQSNIGTPYLEN